MINIIVMDYKLRNNEKGVISIIVTMVFIIVVGLIVLGFGEISRNQSRQTVDNQLSTASYYAAQSGINTILDKIIKLQTATNPGCALSNDNTGIISFNSNSSSRITCASWTNSVDKLIWDDISVNKSQTAYIPLSAPYTLTVKWHNVGNSAIIADSNCDGKFYDSVSWSSKCPSAGALRLNISSGLESCSDRACLSNNSRTYFLIPQHGTTDVTQDFSSPTNPVPYYSNDLTFRIICKSPSPCKYINMRSIYSDSSVSISASSGASFVGSQAQIDVTAVTNGVARRVVAQANIAQNSPVGSSDYSIVSTKSLCKNVKVSNTDGNPAGLSFDNFNGYISATYPSTGPCKSY